MAELHTLTVEDIPNENFGVFLLNRMRGFGDRIALTDAITEKSFTFQEVSRRTERVAAGLQKIGVVKGDVIGIVSPNHKDYLVASVATCLVSAVFQPLNPTYTKDDINRSVKNCGTKFIITTPELLSKVKEGLAELPSIKVIIFGDADGCIPFEDIADPNHGGFTSPEVDPKTTVALLMSSSGTTGLPKAVQLSHYAVIAQIKQLIAAGVVKGGDTCMLYLPMFHIYGLVALAFLNMANGAKSVIIPKFVPDEFLCLIEKYRPRILNAVPPVMVMIAKHPRISDYDLSSIQGVTCGAAPLSNKVEDIVKQRLKLDHITQGFGMTEVGATHFNTETAYRNKSVGKTVPLVETKIVDIDSDEILGTGEKGEIWVRGPQVSIGYLNMPRETEEMFLKDGWVRTGDVGYEDEDGFLFVLDRLKELIKFKAFQVAPAVLEDVLLRHDSVLDAGVVGVPNEEAGELPRAYIVRKEGSEVTRDELVEFVTGQVAPFMKLRGGVEFVDKIPRSLSGKILRKTLRQLAQGTNTN